MANRPSTASRAPVRMSELDLAAFPRSTGRVTALLMPTITEPSGELSFGETPTHFPFVPQRYFLVRDVPAGIVRGNHAHREVHELLICVQGECRVAFDDGEVAGVATLDRPDVGLHLPPLVWASQSCHSPGAVLLVLASRPYDPSDYVHDRDEFRRLLGLG